MAAPARFPAVHARATALGRYNPGAMVVFNLDFPDRPPKARAYAAAVGGPWEWSMRPSGLVAVVVPSGWQVMAQPQR